MLSIADYNHLKLLYESYKKFSEQIRELASSDDWVTIEATIKDKDAFLRKIIFFEKPRIEDIKENKELLTIRNEIIDIEKNNIIFINQLKDELSKQITGVRKTKKIYGAYEPMGVDSITSFEIKDVFDED